MLFRGTFVHCPTLASLDILHDYVLHVDDSGFISHIAPAEDERSAQLLSELKEGLIAIPDGEFLVPSFVDLSVLVPVNMALT